MTFSTYFSPGVALQGGGGSSGGGGGTPGGSSGQIQYNSGGAFAGMAGTSWDNTARALTITGYSLNGSASASFMDLAGTWNTSGTPTAIKLNITDTASNAASLLMDLQRSGTTRFSVSKTGAVNLANSDSGVGALLLSGGFWGSIDAFSFTLKNNNGSFVLGASSDLILTRRGAANLRLGAADTTGTTAPTPQFLSAQSWASSTTNNQTGANFTIEGSQGTGTGAGGSIIFRVAPAGVTANGVQNALSAALTINSARQLLVDAAGAANAPAIVIGASAGLYQVAGTTLSISNNNAETARFGISVLRLGTSSLGFGADFTTQDIFLTRDAANTLALKNAANAQEFRVYETTTGTIYKAILGNRQLMKIAGAAFDNGAGANAGTLTNSPVTGNPTKWIPIDDNGTTRYIPAW